MNKMGLYQRFWCLFVTIVLMLAAADIYPDYGRKSVEASGTGDTANSLNVRTTESEASQNTKDSAVFTSVRNTKPSEMPATGRVILHSQETISSGASSLGGASRSTRPAAIQAPQPVEGTEGRKKTNAASKLPATVPVSAPAPEQIITSLKVMATGYTAGFESTGKTSKHPQYGITYSGVKVRRDKNAVSTIAADPKVLPLGSILYIPGYGYAVVADTGSAIKGRKIDLYFSTTKQVYKEWGKKTVVVQLIKRGNGKCTESMLKSLSRAIQTYKTVPQDLLEEIV